MHLRCWYSVTQNKARYGLQITVIQTESSCHTWIAIPKANQIIKGKTAYKMSHWEVLYYRVYCTSILLRSFSFLFKKEKEIIYKAGIARSCLDFSLPRPKNEKKKIQFLCNLMTPDGYVTYFNFYLFPLQMQRKINEDGLANSNRWHITISVSLFIAPRPWKDRYLE